MARETLAAQSRCPVAGGTVDTALVCPFDPFTPEYMEDPAGFVRRVAGERPIFFAPALGYWVVTRYDTIKAIFRDPWTFSPANVLEPVQPHTPEARAILERYGYAMARTLVNEDEPQHMQRRRVLMAPFTPEHLAAHEPLVRRLVREAVDSFVDSGRVDLVERLLWPVPFTVALHFLGIDEEDQKRMKRFSIAHTVNAFGRPTPEERLAIAETVGQFWQFSGEILEKMRRTPDGPGWMRYSIRQQKLHPEIVTDSYLHSMMMAIIVAAHETTAFAAANAVRTLLSRPGVWRELHEDPALISPAVEECLRLQGSIASWRRRTTRPVELEGVALPAGSNILMVVAAANRDPAHFPDPEELDIRRENAQDHLTFGFGAHQCLGKNLGRMEIQIMLEELTRRLPHLRLAEQSFEYVANLSFRGPQHLWVGWDPAENPERRDPSLRTRSHPARIGAPLARDRVRRLVVRSVERLAEDVVALELAAPDGAPLPRWTPGAHIEVECGDPDRARAYSLCSDPAELSRWRIAVLREPEGRGGSAWIHEAVRPGTILRVRGPRNRFPFDESFSGPILFLAGGIGITPLLPMAARARALGRDYRLVYCGRRRSRMAFLEELAALHGERLRLAVSEEGTRLDLEALLAATPVETRIWACGPTRMLEELERAVQGRPEGVLTTERFASTTGRLDPSKERAFEVELAHSGLTLTVPPDRTLLEVLRAANVDLSSDCEEGLCGTCEVAVLEGEVDHRDTVLSRSERAQHRKMMACCSRALGPRLVLAL
jgi:cytochrome P450/ferredoxin-NADP reductase